MNLKCIVEHEKSWNILTVKKEIHFYSGKSEQHKRWEIIVILMVSLTQRVIIQQVHGTGVEKEFQKILQIKSWTNSLLQSV